MRCLDKNQHHFSQTPPVPYFRQLTPPIHYLFSEPSSSLFYFQTSPVHFLLQAGGRPQKDCSTFLNTYFLMVLLLDSAGELTGACLLAIAVNEPMLFTRHDTLFCCEIVCKQTHENSCLSSPSSLSRNCYIIMVKVEDSSCK